MSFRIAKCSVVFSIVAFALEGWLCQVIADRCTSTGNVSFFTMIIPNLILLGLYFLVGIGVVFLIERMVQIATSALPILRFLLRLISGGIIGWIVSSLASAILGGSSIATSLTNVATNFPFTVGGIICALVNGMLSGTSPSVPSAHPSSGSKVPDSKIF